MLFITILLGELSSGDHEKIMAICSKDVHGRDVSASLQAQKVHVWISCILHSHFVLPSVIYRVFCSPFRGMCNFRTPFPFADFLWVQTTEILHAYLNHSVYKFISGKTYAVGLNEQNVSPDWNWNRKGFLFSPEPQK